MYTLCVCPKHVYNQLDTYTNTHLHHHHHPPNQATRKILHNKTFIITTPPISSLSNQVTEQPNPSLYPNHTHLLSRIELQQSSTKRSTQPQILTLVKHCIGQPQTQGEVHWLQPTVCEVCCQLHSTFRVVFDFFTLELGAKCDVIISDMVVVLLGVMMMMMMMCVCE